MNEAKKLKISSVDDNLAKPKFFSNVSLSINKGTLVFSLAKILLKISSWGLLVNKLKVVSSLQEVSIYECAREEITANGLNVKIYKELELVSSVNSL